MKLYKYGHVLLPFVSNRSAQTFLRVVLHSKRIRLADKTCTFGRQNMYVWPTKRVRLADKTCMFDWQNVYVWPAKRTRLAFKITSLERGLTTFDEQRPYFYKTWAHVWQHLKVVYNVKTTNVNKFDRSYSLSKLLHIDLRNLIIGEYLKSGQGRREVIDIGGVTWCFDQIFEIILTKFWNVLDLSNWAVYLQISRICLWLWLMLLDWLYNLAVIS